MAAIKGRAKRQVTGPTVIMQARVAPAARARAHTAAAALGISLAAYLEQLVLRDDLDEAGRPTWADTVDRPESLLNSA